MQHLFDAASGGQPPAWRPIRPLVVRELLHVGAGVTHYEDLAVGLRRVGIDSLRSDVNTMERPSALAMNMAICDAFGNTRPNRICCRVIGAVTVARRTAVTSGARTRRIITFDSSVSRENGRIIRP